MIKGPAIIGQGCQIRHNAYIRENVIIGDGCVVGNSSELKNSLLFNDAQAPHFNYVGDSILGHKAHLGAGVKISNFKLFPGNIEVEMDGVPFDTGLRKFGALLGDGAEAGCNAVLNPGSILGRGAVVYPNVFWRGILPANMIAKNKAGIDVVVKRPRESLNATNDEASDLQDGWLTRFRVKSFREFSARTVPATHPASIQSTQIFLGAEPGQLPLGKLPGADFHQFDGFRQ